MKPERIKTGHAAGHLAGCRTARTGDVLDCECDYYERLGEVAEDNRGFVSAPSISELKPNEQDAEAARQLWRWHEDSKRSHIIIGKGTKRRGPDEISPRFVNGKCRTCGTVSTPDSGGNLCAVCDAGPSGEPKMECPHCGRKISDADVAAYMGAKGGSATGPTKARDSAKMRDAALKRWARADPKGMRAKTEAMKARTDAIEAKLSGAERIIKLPRKRTAEKEGRK